jgi:hypothetical protein
MQDKVDDDDDDAGGDDDDDVADDDVVRACAIATHVKISQEPLYIEICK